MFNHQFWGLIFFFVCQIAFLPYFAGRVSSDAPVLDSLGTLAVLHDLQLGKVPPDSLDPGAVDAHSYDRHLAKRYVNGLTEDDPGGLVARWVRLLACSRRNHTKVTFGCFSSMNTVWNKIMVFITLRPHLHILFPFMILVSLVLQLF